MERLTAAASDIRLSGRYRWVGLYEVKEDQVRLVAHSGGEAPAFPVFGRDEGLTGEAIQTRAPVVSNDVSTDPRYLTAFGTTGSEMIVPIVDSRSGEVIGTIDVESDGAGAFGGADSEAVARAAATLEPLFRTREER